MEGEGETWLFTPAVVVATLAVIAAILWWKGQHQKTNNSYLQQIPPCAVPGIDPSDEELGNLGDMGKAGSLLEFLVNLHHEYGPLASFWWGKQQAISIASPDLFKEYSKLFNRPAVMFMLFEPLLTKHSIVYANGPEGQKRHSAYLRCYSHEVLRDYAGILYEVVEEQTNEWLLAAEANKQVNLGDDCFSIAIKSITRTSFGELFKDNEEINNLAKHYHIAWSEMENRLSGSIPSTDSPREKALKQSSQAIVDVVLKARKMCLQSGDSKRQMLIDVIVELGLPEEVQVADAVSVLVGGFHTTGNLLTWCFYFLALHQDIQERILQELNEVLEKNPVSLYYMSELVYLRQVLDETLRVSMLVPYSARYSEEEMSLGGYKIPPGIPVVHALGVTLQDKNLWTEPERFDPDRFSSDNRKTMSHSLFEPFGFAGGRKCVAYHFAYTEATFVIATVLRKLKVKLIDVNLKVTPVFGLVTHPKETILVYFEKRD